MRQVIDHPAQAWIRLQHGGEDASRAAAYVNGKPAAGEIASSRDGLRLAAMEGPHRACQELGVGAAGPVPIPGVRPVSRQRGDAGSRSLAQVSDGVPHGIVADQLDGRCLGRTRLESAAQRALSVHSIALDDDLMGRGSI
jgi:hypothetical protein